MDENKLEANILIDQLRLTYKQIPTIILGVLISSLVVAAIFESRVAGSRIVIWLIMQFMVYPVLLGRAWFLFKLYDIQSDSVHKWKIRIVWLSCLSGLSLGLSAFFLFDPSSFENQLMIFCYITATAALILVSFTAFRPAFLVAIIAVLAPLMMRHIVIPEMLNISVVIFISLYGISLVYFHRNINEAFIDSITLKYRNAALIKQLSEQREIAENAREQAEQANIEKSRFLASASHDLRQPLHALNLFIGELSNRNREETIKPVIEKIGASTQALGDLFNALLDMSRLDAGAVQPDMFNFEINSLLADIELEYFPLADEKRLKFVVVPSTAIVHSDPVLLGNILRNLMANAIRYTENGSILLGCRYRGDKLVIQVRDSGIGISVKDQKSIFKEYYQLNNPERNQKKGLGLGLSMVERTARLLGHKVEVISEPGNGSVFGVEIPRVTYAKDSSNGSSDKTASEDFPTHKNILVIDDNIEVQQAMFGLLTSWDCKVVTAGSGEDALEVLEKTEFDIDLIIADYRLREEKTGIDAIHLICSRSEKEVPGILVSGDTGAERIQEVAMQGFELIHKPVPPEELRKLILKKLAV